MSLAVTTTMSESSGLVSLWNAASPEEVNLDTNWMVKTRGGTSYYSGPQIPDNKNEKCAENKINYTCRYNTQDGWSVNRFRFPTPEGIVAGVKCYPPLFNRTLTEKCVVYCNPLGSAVGDYFENDSFIYTPSRIAKLRQCPIYLFDYRGISLSKNANEKRFDLSYYSIIEDTKKVVHQALTYYKEVEIWGSSFGGLAAFAAADALTSLNPNYNKRIKLLVLDCMSWTGGWPLKQHINAQTCLDNLVKRKISITLLSHIDDPVIPEKVRIAKYAINYYQDKTKVYESPSFGHGNLNDDMVEFIKNTEAKENDLSN